MDTSEDQAGDGATKRRLNSTIVAAGVAFGLTLAGLGVAAAQTSSTPDTTTAPAAGSTGSSGSGEPAAGAQEQRPAGLRETELTGDVADKVKAAALAAVPGGTIIRVENDSDGSPYEAHVRKADGTEVVVKVDAGFKVTATEEGHGGPGHDGLRSDDGGAPQPTN